MSPCALSGAVTTWLGSQAVGFILGVIAGVAAPLIVEWFKSAAKVRKASSALIVEVEAARTMALVNAWTIQESRGARTPFVAGALLEALHGDRVRADLLGETRLADLARLATDQALIEQRNKNDSQRGIAIAVRIGTPFFTATPSILGDLPTTLARRVANLYASIEVANAAADGLTEWDRRRLGLPEQEARREVQRHAHEQAQVEELNRIVVQSADEVIRELRKR